MLNDVVSIGDKLELRHLSFSTNSNKSEKVYKSKVIDFISEDTVNIMMPIEGSKLIPLSVGEKYNLCFFTKKGLYQCKSVIIDRSRANNVYTLIIQITTELEKYQRRQFYRFEYLLEFKYRLISDLNTSIHEPNTLENEKQMSGTILDISGGGARFVSEHSHKRGDMLLMCMEFDTNKITRTFHIKAFIISSYKMVNRKGYYEHRVQFKDIPEDEREAIIKFIFEKERQQRNIEKH